MAPKFFFQLQTTQLHKVCPSTQLLKLRVLIYAKSYIQISTTRGERNNTALGVCMRSVNNARSFNDNNETIYFRVAIIEIKKSFFEVFVELHLCLLHMHKPLGVGGRACMCTDMTLLFRDAIDVPKLCSRGGFLENLVVSEGPTPPKDICNYLHFFGKSKPKATQSYLK